MTKKDKVLKELATLKATGTTQVDRKELDKICRKAGCVYTNEITAHFAWLLATDQIRLAKTGAGVFELR